MLIYCYSTGDQSILAITSFELEKDHIWICIKHGQVSFILWNDDSGYAGPVVSN